MRKQVSIITLLFVFSSLYATADVLKTTGMMTTNYLPGNENIEDLFRYYENINNKRIEEGKAVENQFLVAQINSKNVLESGYSKSVPFILYLDLSQDGEYIERYRMEYIPAVLETSDSSFTTSNPVFSHNLKITIVADIINGKKMVERHDLANNVKDLEINDTIFRSIEGPESLLFIDNVIKDMLKMEPVSSVQVGQETSSHYIYRNKEVELIRDSSANEAELLLPNLYYKINYHPLHNIPQSLNQTSKDRMKSIEITSVEEIGSTDSLFEIKSKE